MDLHPWVEDLLRALQARSDGDYEIPHTVLDDLQARALQIQSGTELTALVQSATHLSWVLGTQRQAPLASRLVLATLAPVVEHLFDLARTEAKAGRLRTDAARDQARMQGVQSTSASPLSAPTAGGALGKKKLPQ